MSINFNHAAFIRSAVSPKDFLRDGPLAHIMEQGKSGIEMNFFRSQRWNESSGGKGTQKPFCQVFKLYAVGRLVN